jgi:pyruvate dehydrogenase E1 component alpha subunit
VGDIDRSYYRSKKEEDEWKTQRDPLKLLADWMKKGKLVDGAALDKIETEISTEIKAAVSFALNAAYPDPDEVNQHVYA